MNAPKIFAPIDPLMRIVRRPVQLFVNARSGGKIKPVFPYLPPVFIRKTAREDGPYTEKA